MAKTSWGESLKRLNRNWRFSNQYRQLHAYSNVLDFSSDIEKAIAATNYVFDVDRLSAAAAQIESSLSLEIGADEDPGSEDVIENYRRCGNLLYWLAKASTDVSKKQDKLLRAAWAFELAGYSANSHVALSAIGDIQRLKANTIHHLTYNYLRKKLLPIRKIDANFKFATEDDQGGLFYLKALQTIDRYWITGDIQYLQHANDYANESLKHWLKGNGGNSNWYFARALQISIQKAKVDGLWTSVGNALGGPLSPLWKRYIRRLAVGLLNSPASVIVDENTSSIVSLWRSQKESLDRGLLAHGKTDFVVKMPTSAGKTRIAEMLIIETMSGGNESVCVYVVPYIALANEVRDSLRKSLGGIGLRVVDLFEGEYDPTLIESGLFRTSDVVITTPEKLDLFLRSTPEAYDAIKLFIFDESHMIDESVRGIRYEALLERLRRLRSSKGFDYRIALISAVVPNASDLSAWISGNANNLIESEWKPTQVNFGVFHWATRTSTTGIINYPAGYADKDRYFVPHVIDRRLKRTNYFPGSKGEICSELALKLVGAGPVAIFTANKTFLKSVVNQVLKRTAGDDQKASLLRTDATYGSQLNYAISLAVQYMGAENLMVSALRAGFAYHNGDVPQPVRKIVERLYTEGAIKLLVCTNTLGQGVNLPIKTLIVHSIYRGDIDIFKTRILARDFRNMAGRAARASRHLEGQVIFVHDNESSNLKKDEKELVDGKGADAFVISGLGLLYAYLASRDDSLIADARSGKMLRLLANARGLGPDSDPNRMEESLVAFDALLLELLAEDYAIDVDTEIAGIFVGSLFDIQMKEFKVDYRPFLSHISNRAKLIKQKSPSEEFLKTSYRTGLSLESCHSLFEGGQGILGDMISAPEDFQGAKDLVLKLFRVCVGTKETSSVDYVTFNQDECFWRWLNGASVDQLPRSEGISQESLSLMVEDLFVRKVPWGLNALMILLKSTLDERGIVLRPYLQMLAVFSRFGVSNIAAAILRSLGVGDRQVALAIGTKIPFSVGIEDAERLRQWVAGLGFEEFVSIAENLEAARQAYSEILEAQVGNPGARRVKLEKIDSVEIKGLRYNVSWAEVTHYSDATRFSVQREPDNPHDTNAISLKAEGKKVGYLARDIARIFAPMMDAGIEMSAQFEGRHSPEGYYPAGRLYVKFGELVK